MGKKSSIVGGVAILTLASILVKVIGMFYKIPLTYVLGDEGMGYFNAAYTIYAWLYMLSTAGFPVAVSIVVSEARGKGEGRLVKRTLRVAFLALLIIGSITSIGMAVFAKPIARVLGTEGAYLTVLAISPTLILICITSFFRGCFQGHQRMAPTAISQLLEAIGKAGIGMAFAILAKRRGAPITVISAYAVMGVTVGTLISTLYLWVQYLYAKKKGELEVEEKVPYLTSQKPILRRLLSIALPVTISASVISLTSLIDLGMIIRRLTSIGYTPEEATAIYGNYTTLVIPMFNLPSVVVTPIASGIIPAISHCFSRGDKQRVRELMHGAFRTVALIAVPASIGLALFSRPILSLLYPTDSAEAAYRLLTTIAPAVYFVCILTLTNAVLQAHGLAKFSMVTMLVGGVAKVVVGYILLGNVNFGIYGSPIGTIVCYGIAMLCNMFALITKLGYAPQISYLLVRPLAASMLGILPIAYIYIRNISSLTSKVWTLFFIGIAALLYGAFACLVGAVKREDLQLVIKPKPLTSREM